MFAKKENTIKYLKTSIAVALTICMYACNQTPIKTNSNIFDAAKEKTEISNMLDSFNRAAANANYQAYFNFYTDDAVFTGTDPTERWNKNEYMVWAKPFFDKGKAWNFTSLNRHIYFNKDGNFAWFDELLNTQMKICRGSGVLVKNDNNWKIEQYILSTTVPNNLLDSVINLKALVEDSIINNMRK